MKKLNFKSICLLFCMFAIAHVVNADGHKEFTKVIQKDFQIDAEGLVEIENRKGSVEVISWDKSHVDIEVTISVDAKSEEDANEVFEQIDIEFSNNSSSVSAKTDLNNSGNNKPWWKKWSWRGKNKISYQIDYIVKMPETCNLDLEHSYGHATVTDLLSDVVIEMQYGDLKVGKIGGDLDLELGYGDAKVIEASKVDAEVWYSEFRINSLDKMEIESRYSEISVDQATDIDSESQYDQYSIGQIDDIRSNGRYDDFEIEQVNNIDVESQYSDYVMEQLSQSADMDMQYGDAIIKRLKAGFSRVKLEGIHSGFKIKTDDSASYMLNIEADYTHVEYPKQILRSDIDKEGSYLHFDGIIGTEKSPSSEIRCETTYGQLIID